MSELCASRTATTSTWGSREDSTVLDLTTTDPTVRATAFLSRVATTWGVAEDACSELADAGAQLIRKVAAWIATHPTTGRQQSPAATIRLRQTTPGFVVVEVWDRRVQLVPIHRQENGQTYRAQIPWRHRHRYYLMARMRVGAAGSP
ncbi:hypothetical protein [Nocardia noduli]|uniref:hypothetical protein n=1 Tax=Nocardia noduli TaxID=2815722 RepID=UPI001C245D54|nr:hypothetical protein [Nocardia noduli]